jgi:hypothetical protein
MYYCDETRNRIKLLIAAYAYEFKGKPTMTDKEFDDLCMQINVDRKTNKPKLDKWFKKNFQPCTGMWIHRYPELNKLKKLYESLSLR